MCQEVYELVQEIGMEKLDLQIVLQCAPLSAGLKASNLLITKPANKAMIQAIFAKSGISWFRLEETRERLVLLVFRKEALEQSLSQKAVQEMMAGFGYETTSLGKVLMRFRKNYAHYRAGRLGFPHEMGLLLDYPTEDVEGFIKSRGKDFLYSGYWKVYGNVPYKLRLFQKFDLAERKFTRMLKEGAGIAEVIQNCKTELQKAAV